MTEIECKTILKTLRSNELEALSNLIYYTIVTGSEPKNANDQYKKIAYLFYNSSLSSMVYWIDKIISILEESNEYYQENRKLFEDVKELINNKYLRNRSNEFNKKIVTKYLDELDSLEEFSDKNNIFDLIELRIEGRYLPDERRYAIIDWFVNTLLNISSNDKFALLDFINEHYELTYQSRVEKLKAVVIKKELVNLFSQIDNMPISSQIQFFDEACEIIKKLDDSNKNEHNNSTLDGSSQLPKMP